MFSAEYSKAIEAARGAGEIIARYYGSTYTVRQKSKDQPVTEADREANQFIQETLHAAFPNDGWISEETQDDLARLKSKRVWIVDPLDGTKEFINHIPEFAVSIGLAENGFPVVGVIYNPITDEMFTCQKGKGAFLNESQIRVSATSKLIDSTIVASRSETDRGEWKKYDGQFAIKPLGSMAYKMAHVAAGFADGSFSLTPKTEWDFCAGDLLVAEAGGKISDLKSRPFKFNNRDLGIDGLIYGNPQIFTQLSDLALKGRTQ